MFHRLLQMLEAGILNELLADEIVAKTERFGDNKKLPRNGKKRHDRLQE